MIIVALFEPTYGDQQGNGEERQTEGLDQIPRRSAENADPYRGNPGYHHSRGRTVTLGREFTGEQVQHIHGDGGPDNGEQENTQ